VNERAIADMLDVTQENEKTRDKKKEQKQENGKGVKEEVSMNDRKGGRYRRNKRGKENRSRKERSKEKFFVACPVLLVFCVPIKIC
jgi:hypothetical protein